MISHYLVLGIAPIGYNKQSKDSSTLFWIYYPGFRKTLAQSHIVSERVSQIENMDDVIYFRDYSGALYKPTNNNPYNVDFKNYPNMYKKNISKMALEEDIEMIEKENDMLILFSSKFQ